MRKFSLCLLVLTIILSSFFNVYADGITIEQIISSRPNVSVYGDFKFEDLSQITASATIGEEILEFTGARHFETDEGIMYLFLVDCSTSISKTQMSNIKSALKEFINFSKNENDHICIISFGLQTDVLCDGSETDAEILNTIDKLNNNQNGTVLFDAMDKAVEIANISDSTLPQRKVAVIISDADDFNVGGHTVEEIVNLAETSSLPFYSIGLNTGSKAGLDTFGQIARASGARIVVSTTNGIKSEMENIVDDIKECDVITFKADGNVISGKQQLLNLNIFNDGKTYTASRTIMDLQWSVDNEEPCVTDYVQLAPNIIKLTFNEDVLEAGNTSSYTISRNGRNIPLLSASYEKSTHSATLTFAQTPVSGKYNIKFSAITDNSMEKNIIKDDIYSVKIKGRNPVIAFISLVFTDYWWILLILLIAAACFICYNILKKRNGLMFVNGKFSFGDKVKFKAKPDNPKPQHNVIFDVKDSAGMVTELDLTITTSMIFGRSNMCDITLSDVKLSRQHFVVETDNSGFTISNLSETNGTILNGVKMNGRRKLQEGDKILAGQTEFTVRKLRY